MLFLLVMCALVIENTMTSSFGDLSLDIHDGIMSRLEIRDKASFRVNRRLDHLYRTNMRTKKVSKMKHLFNQIKITPLFEIQDVIEEIKALRDELQFTEQYLLEKPFFVQKWIQEMEQRTYTASIVEEVLSGLGIDKFDEKSVCGLDPVTGHLVGISHSIWTQWKNGKRAFPFDTLFARALWDHLSAKNDDTTLPDLHELFRFGDESKTDYLRYLVMNCGLILIHPHFLNIDHQHRNESEWKEEWNDVRNQWKVFQAPPQIVGQVEAAMFTRMFEDGGAVQWSSAGPVSGEERLLRVICVLCCYLKDEQLGLLLVALHQNEASGITLRYIMDVVEQTDRINDGSQALKLTSILQSVGMTSSEWVS